jgi:hypothetical protein
MGYMLSWSGSGKGRKRPPSSHGVPLFWDWKTPWLVGYTSLHSVPRVECSFW